MAEEGIAMVNAYLALVRVLHKRGVIDMEDVVVEFGNIIDMHEKRGLNPENLPFQKIIYEAMVKVSASLKASRGEG